MWRISVAICKIHKLGAHKVQWGQKYAIAMMDDGHSYAKCVNLTRDLSYQRIIHANKQTKIDTC